MKPAPLPPCFCPHGWRKFQQAQRNMIRHLSHGRRKQRQRRAKKWARTLGRWTPKIYGLNFWFTEYRDAS